MVPASQYVRSNPEIDPNIFESAFPEEIRPLFAPYVTGIEDVVKLLQPRVRGVRGRGTQGGGGQSVPAPAPAPPPACDGVTPGEGLK